MLSPTLQLTRDTLDTLYRSLYGPAMPKYLLLGFRGMLPVEQEGNEARRVPNVQEVYNDAVGYLYENTVSLWTGSVDPGRYFTRHPVNSGGCAHIQDGRHVFVKGPHRKERRAWRGQDVLCWRDKDRDGVQDPSERNSVILRTSLNLHYGGWGNTIGEYSAGCVIVRQPGWAAFRDRTYAAFPVEATLWVLDGSVVWEAVFDPTPRRPSVSIEGVVVPNSVPMWLEHGRVVTVARDFLAYLKEEGKPVRVSFIGIHAGKEVVIRVGAAMVVLRGGLVNGRGVFSVTELLRALDPKATIQWKPAEKAVEVFSSRIAVGNPKVEVLDKAPEAGETEKVQG